MNPAIKNIIAKLNLKPHVEGGYFHRTYQSTIDIQVNNKTRAINTAIYYLLEGQDFSCWHRLKSDEIWHYYCGSPMIIHQLDKHGLLSSTILGNFLEYPNAVPQCILPAGTWFAAEVESPTSFSLIGCTVSPGFDYEDFEIGNQAELLKQYPQHEKLILKFIKIDDQ